MDPSVLFEHTPQRPPQKIGWSIRVTFLLYNDEKPDITRPRRQVEFDVLGASPSSSGPNAFGITRNFTSHLENIQMNEQHTPYSQSRLLRGDANTSTNQQQQQQIITISSLLHKDTQQQMFLTCDSTIFELKEAISQRCNASQVFSDTFCLVFDRKVLPDWPSLNPKSLAELGLYDNCMVYAVEFDKSQYMLRETLATRLVLRATQERKRRLDNAFDLAQDCLHSARGFSSLIEEEVYPPLYEGRKKEISNLQTLKRKEGPESSSSKDRLEELREKRQAERNAVAFEIFSRNTKILEAELDEAAAARPQTSSSTEYGRRKSSSLLSNSSKSIPDTSLLPQKQQQQQQRPTTSASNNVTSSSSPRTRFTPVHASKNQNDLDNLGGWNNSSSSGDRLLKKKWGLRGEVREQSYREYFDDTPRKKKEAEERGLMNTWVLNGKATSEMD